MSSHQIVIPAETRETASKGATRQLRNSDKVPAVLYRKSGNATLSIPVKGLPKGHTGGQLVSLELGGTTHTVLMREVQVDPITSKPLHIDFQEIAPTTVTSARIPVEFVGLTKEQEKDCSFRALIRSVQLRGPASKFPAKVQIQVGALQPDETLQLADEHIPADLTVRGSRKIAIAQLVRK